VRMPDLHIPVWVAATHFLNLLFLTLLARSGVEVLSALPKLYLSDHCPPGRELVRFSKKVFCADSREPWSSLDEEESWSPVIALPGRKNLGLARHWHFMTVQFWILTGLVYVALLFATGEWRRLVPTSWSIVPDAFHAAATYLNGHLAEPKPGHPYNALQQLAYFAVVFLLAPFQIATGAAMSPSIIARFPRYTRLFGGKQAARTLHFLGLCAFAAFVVVHTVMVLLHGLGGEFTYIVLASDPAHANETLALVVGLVGFAVVVLINVAATVFSLRHRRRVQRLTGKLVDPFERLLSRWLTSRQRYTRADISPYHRVNGYPPPDPSYQRLAEHDFAGYRLEVCGLVERPLSLALGDLRALAATSQITKHNCIQGWTNIAEWGGVPLAAILDQCRPTPQARYLVFYAYDDKAITENEGRFGHFYGTIPLQLARRPQTILALDMNGAPLPVEHGAPVRLRVETQLGFKMVKWIRSIELVADYARIGMGQGGWREDQQYYANAAGI
jgi:DMSO/TMAO reductase YedYZ molybdopterin-dependent catalytic subunit/thiosulfate reductase cytochrome b subunit